jgi:hypothetical protein
MEPQILLNMLPNYKNISWSVYKESHRASRPKFSWESGKMGDSDYSFSLTTFSPSGKLVQIEYALNAVAAGATSLGIRGTFLLN